MYNRINTTPQNTILLFYIIVYNHFMWYLPLYACYYLPPNLQLAVNYCSRYLYNCSKFLVNYTWLFRWFTWATFQVNYCLALWIDMTLYFNFAQLRYSSICVNTMSRIVSNRKFPSIDHTVQIYCPYNSYVYIASGNNPKYNPQRLLLVIPLLSLIHI